ncbi:uncharacterized protein LOC130771873 isoform X2 [Actinidia eriantha]|uniref:uncharacterized protein LOC130771873 isoform X2 n=1 Tax=Actinidia eriantha TaxID=165200 RepID=UPI0025890C2D|nr:uncharacterized protein LOC130771873 isoform X2 [Actinidia eriantha]
MLFSRQWRRAREREMDGLTEEERRALRGSKFAPLPSAPPSSRSNPRLAHPGGPLTTNKAAALAKFLERKLQDPNGLASIKPELLELAVKNAKDAVNASNYQSGGAPHSGRVIRHVDSFDDSELPLEDEGGKIEPKKLKKKKKKKDKGKNKLQKRLKDTGDDVLKRPKKKLTL